MSLKPCPFTNHIEIAEHLHSIGWKSPNDAQWHHLKEWCDEMCVEWSTRPIEEELEKENADQKRKLQDYADWIESDEVDDPKPRVLEKENESLKATLKRVEALGDRWAVELEENLKDICAYKDHYAASNGTQETMLGELRAALKGPQ